MLRGYEVLRRISDGAAAEVFLARPENAPDHVVAEVMRRELLRDSALVARFLAEAKVRRGFSHPNIAQRVQEGTTADGRPWLVSEPVGESLASRLTARGPLPVEALLPLAMQVCEGLAFMHAAGMVHGNLKPAAVYLAEQSGSPPRVRIIDFGLSFLRPGRSLPRPVGVILVEPEYLAPERVRGQRGTPLADLYGLGVLLYELLTGFPPFTGADSSVVRRRHIEEPPAALPSSCALLAKVVERCLAKDPAARFQSANAVKAALKELACAASAEPVDDLEISLGPEDVVPAPDERVGNYELLQPLGEGSMGRVFLARHVTLDRRVALKILKPELARSRAEVDRFVQEAQAVNRISHQHIVEISDCVNETLPAGERRVYFVMELLQGQSLRDHLRQGPLPLSRALRILRQVASALDAAHRVGVVHRDVKPDNIFVTTRAGADFVKVLDFGVAKLRGQGAETENGAPVAIGTPGYMAPEQVLGRPTDHRADVYGLGVVLYRIVCGQPPFSGSTFETLAAAIIRDPPPPLPAQTQRGEPLPEALRALITACLEKDPERRPQTMAEVGTALDGLLAEAPVAPAAPTPQRRRRGAAVPLALTGLALALASGAWALLGRTRADAPAPPPPEQRPSSPDSSPVPSPTAVPEAAPRPAWVRVSVASQPAGARVARADTREELGTTPVDLALPAQGEVPVTITLPGFAPATARLGADSPSPMLLKLRPLPGRTHSGPGKRSPREVNRDDVIDPFAR